MLRLLALLAGAASALEPPPRFDLDLSKAPEDRWNGAVALVLSRHDFEHSFLPVFQEHNATLFSKLTDAHFATIGGAVSKHFPTASAELRGIARQLAAAGHAVTYEYLAAWLYFHELAHSDVAAVDARECTGIVAQAADGSVFHAANMDQSPLAARNLTLRIRVRDAAGAIVFEGVDWYTLLSTGVSRAVKKGLASVQENWRTTTKRSLQEVLRDIENGVISQMLVFRRAFEGAHGDKLAGRAWSFQDFVENVTKTPLAAPFYIVAAGAKPGEGVAIARNLTGADGADWLNGQNRDDFFLCQCNTDRWLPDDPQDPRRTAAEALLQQMGQEEASMLGLFAVSSAYPVHNPHTAYTAMMSASTGEFHAYVREASCPLDPYASVVVDRRYCLHENSQPGILLQ